MKFTDLAFKLNELETFIYNFKYEDKIVSEYIHGIVTEYVETDSQGAPTIIKINQVSNLKDYVENKKVTFTEREFRVSALSPFVNYKKI